jgi:hypothetical protein
MPNYKIKKGDTLSAIAKKEGTTVSELMKLNPQIKDKNLIYAGAGLNLPYDMGKLESNVKSTDTKKAVALNNQLSAGIKSASAQGAAIVAKDKGKSGSFGAGVATGVAGTAVAGAIANKISKNKAAKAEADKAVADKAKKIPKKVKAGKLFVSKPKMVGVDISTMKSKMKNVIEPIKRLAVKKDSLKSAISKVAKSSAKIAKSSAKYAKVAGKVAGKALGRKIPGSSKMLDSMFSAKVKK